jgi:hypothetical protein
MLGGEDWNTQLARGLAHEPQHLLLKPHLEGGAKSRSRIFCQDSERPTVSRATSQGVVELVEIQARFGAWDERLHEAAD